MSITIFGATDGRGGSAASDCRRWIVWNNLFRGRERGVRRHWMQVKERGCGGMFLG